MKASRKNMAGILTWSWETLLKIKGGVGNRWSLKLGELPVAAIFLVGVRRLFYDKIEKGGPVP